MKSLLALCFVLVIPVSFQQKTVTCTKPGLYPLGRGNRFQICREDADGNLLTQFGQCDHLSVFDPELKQCVLAKTKLSVRNFGFGEKCYNRGYSCGDCNTLNYCWDRGNGYEIVATKKCPSNQFCSAYSNSCVSTIIPQCKAEYTYNCNYMGLFPDPYKCGSYYFCEHAGAEAVWMECPPDQYYDPLYTECVKYEVDNQPPCPPMQQCRSDNSMFALERNPNIYYICIWMNQEYTTRVFRCPRDLVFNGQFCVQKNSTVNLTTPSPLAS